MAILLSQSQKALDLLLSKQPFDMFFNLLAHRLSGRLPCFQWIRPYLLYLLEKF
jgi:hypothetical protein